MSPPDEAVDKIKDVAETVDVDVAVVAYETRDRTKDLAEDVGHGITDLVEGLKDRVARSGDDEERAPDA